MGACRVGGLRGGSHGRVLGELGWRGAGGVMAPGGGRARNSETVSTSRRVGGVLGGRRSWREEGGCGARAAEWMSDSRLRVTGARRRMRDSRLRVTGVWG